MSYGVEVAKLVPVLFYSPRKFIRSVACHDFGLGKIQLKNKRFQVLQFLREMLLYFLDLQMLAYGMLTC